MQGIGLYVFAISYVVTVAFCAIGHMSWEYSLGIVVALPAGVIAGKRLGITCAYVIGIAVLGIGVAVVRMAFVPSEIPSAFVPLLNEKVTLEGTVIALPDNRETSDRLMIEIKSGIQKTIIIASVPLYPRIHVGDIISVSGTLKAPEPFETDGGRVFAYPDFLRKDYVFAVMQPAYPKQVGRSTSLWLRFLRVLEWIKEGFMRLIGIALPEPESALAAGLIVGGKQGLGNRLIEAFTRAGMLQIVVLSGYNVMIVANAILRALARLPKRFALSLAFGSIVCFVLIAGAGSSALRAGVMAGIAIYARATGKQYGVMQIVIGALIALGLWNPLLLVFDPGFQFSFIATLGLILGVPLVTPYLLFLRNALLIELVSTTLAAEMSLLPLLLWQTGNLSLVSVFANVVAMPVIPFCMAASALSAVLAMPLGLVSSLLPLIAGFPAYLGLAYVIKVAEVSAALPFATVIIPAFPFWVMAVAYGVLGICVTRGHMKRAALVAPLSVKQDSEESILPRLYTDVPRRSS